MRRILVAPDSFKGSLTAREAAAAIARGLRAVWPEAAIDACPMSDGGEGFLDAIGGEREAIATTNAVGEPIEAIVARLGGTLAIELSGAAGLVQVPPARRDPRVTTTWGVGAAIAAAWARRPFDRLLLALGGSATVDGGAGLLAALGARFLDAEGRELPPGGAALARLARIDASGLSPALRDVLLAVDVENPLVGPRGAAPVYGPQKGADAACVAELAAALGRYADVLEAATGVRVHDLPGAGAAGGVPAGLVALAGARCVPGFALAAEAVGLDARLAGCDLVVTGEGRVDAASFEGKVVGRLAARCEAAGVPLLALAGAIDPGVPVAGMAIVPGPMAIEAACADAAALLEVAAARAAGMVQLGRRRR